MMPLMDVAARMAIISAVGMESRFDDMGRLIQHAPRCGPRDALLKLVANIVNDSFYAESPYEYVLDELDKEIIVSEKDKNKKWAHFHLRSNSRDLKLVNAADSHLERLIKARGRMRDIVWGYDSKKVDSRKLSTILMGSGGDGKPDLVIQYGVVRHYVGIGWTYMGEADKEDYAKYPVVI